ncbi:MAG TPA: hypothetical protein VHS33_03040 [Sphingomicrobium sp.]|jgi:hypothetical protein|nr:hypothetical protein [Sphingomicrobium sp.]
MSKVLYVAAALLVVPAPSLAQIVIGDTPAPAATTKVATTKSDLDKIECRSQDTIGSRLQGHQVCMTKQQWWQAEQDNKRKVEELQDLTPTRPSG